MFELAMLEVRVDSAGRTGGLYKNKLVGIIRPVEGCSSEN